MLKYPLLFLLSLSFFANTLIAQERQSRDQYSSYESIIFWMQQLANEHPEICDYVNVGASVEGRALAYLKISDNVLENESEPEIFFDGGIHGDEIMAAENMIRFADLLCTSYGSDAQMTYLINNREIFIWPMVNPDGRVHEKRLNANGMDLNRDFGFYWKSWGSNTAPFSQPESRAVRDLMMERNFSLHSSFHAGYEGIYYPWSYTQFRTADEDVFYWLSKRYADASGYDTLEYGQVSHVLYKSNGSTKDYDYGSFGMMGWSMEISDDKTPPVSQIPYYFLINKQPMLDLIEAGRFGLHGQVLNAETYEPVSASLQLSSGHPWFFNDRQAGDFHRIVDSGQYQLIVHADGYFPDTLENINVGIEDSLYFEILLHPLNGKQNTAYRLLACGRALSDYSDNPKPWKALSIPDQHICALGAGGWMIVEMNEPVRDTRGADIQLITTNQPLDTLVRIDAANSPDGPWKVLEHVQNLSFDLQQAQLPSARFFRIRDMHDPEQTENSILLDAVREIQKEAHAWIVFSGDRLSEPGGNGMLDPGETGQMTLSFLNNGLVAGQNIRIAFRDTSSYIEITPVEVIIDNMPAGAFQDVVFDISAGTECPDGYTTYPELIYFFNEEADSAHYAFELQIGAVNTAVVDLSLDHYSAPLIREQLAQKNIYTHSFESLNDSILQFETVYICMGMRQYAHLMTPSDVRLIKSFLENGGSAYLEGGDAWFFNKGGALTEMFGIEALDNGEDDLFYLSGLNGGLLKDLQSAYIGTNLSIDRIKAAPTASDEIFNHDEAYCIGVAHDAGTYRTFGTSFEWGGIEQPGQNLEVIHDFLNGHVVSVPDGLKTENTSRLRAFRNPANNEIRISFNAKQGQLCTFEWLDLQGRKIAAKKVIATKNGWNEFKLPDLIKPNQLILLNFRLNDYQECLKIVF